MEKMKDNEKQIDDVNAFAYEDGVECLNPQPSTDPADPLNWSLVLKIGALIQVCLLATLGTLNTAIINPAYVPMAKEFGISTVKASYQTTIAIAMNGIGPFIWVPLANKIGRRPLYLFTTFLGFASALGCAFAQNFGQLIAGRVFNGLFPCAMALGAVSVTDMFYFHQRGRAMGLFTVLLTTGSHLAPIIGGLIGQYLGWRWTFKFAAILDAVMLVTIFFCLPETLFVRTDRELRITALASKLDKRTYLGFFKLWSRHPDLHLRANQFILPPFKMARYPSVIFPCLYYASQYGFASILPAVTVAHIFNEKFKWDTLQIGLGYGAALTIGSGLGELAAGLVVDAIVKSEKRRLGGVDPPPEARLKAIWTGEFLVPIGLLVYGFTIQYRTHWIGPLIGMGISAFGVQIVATTCYTYSIDCYRPEGSEVSLFFNFIRQTFGMTFAFYAIPLAEKIGYQFEFLFFACMGSILAFAGILLTMWRGREWREAMGSPHNMNVFDEDDMEKRK